MLIQCKEYINAVNEFYESAHAAKDEDAIFVRNMICNEGPRSIIKDYSSDPWSDNLTFIKNFPKTYTPQFNKIKSNELKALGNVVNLYSDHMIHFRRRVNNIIHFPIPIIEEPNFLLLISVWNLFPANVIEDNDHSVTIKINMLFSSDIQLHFISDILSQRKIVGLALDAKQEKWDLMDDVVKCYKLHEIQKLSYAKITTEYRIAGSKERVRRAKTLIKRLNSIMRDGRQHD